MTPSPQTMRNSSGLETEKSTSTLLVKRKSEINTLRRSDRDKENFASRYSGSMQNAKQLALKEGEVHQDSVGVKRKKLTGRAFKSLLQRKRNKDIVTAGDDLEDSRTSSVVREISGSSERVPTNCSHAKSKDAPVPETATCLIRLTDDAINSETTPLSTECGNCSLLGACIFCSKEKRISYNSQEKELCTCDATAQKDLCCPSTCKDRVDQGAAFSFEKCHCRNLLEETDSGRGMGDCGTVCAVCNSDNELLWCCMGKDCKSLYRPSCLDPRLPDDLPGVRHCPKCVNKKLELGVYSVSEGIESIWDVREVDVSKAKGIRQRQYLVKYHGLAHIHNHWVPEKQLLLKHQSLVSNFITKDKTARWSAKWTVPHRLLRKRPIMDNFHADIPESYEWLVKWHGLDYNHATWELDSSHFLSSSLGQDLMNKYAIRRKKAKRNVDKGQMGSFVELSELPATGLNVNSNFLLKNVNKLRECWYRSHNTVIFDNQDREMTLVFFIQYLTEICHPFLIIASSDSLSQWDSEFARLAPSVDVAVYNGDSDTRKGIRASEFYEEGGCVMLQVLLTSAEAVFEDLDILSCIGWQSIVIDEYRHSRTSIDLEQIKILTTDLRILLLSGQIKDTASEYLNILSLLDSEHEYNKLRGLRSGKNENLAKFKERLSRFIAYGITSEISKFLEYWVPIQISNHQLEQYCATLISNSILLCACSRNDKVGALRDILLTVRKCCDHPYLVDSSVQQRMIAEGCPAAEILDKGVKASGKLQVLDMMLTQVKARKLQVLVLYQSIGSGDFSTGDILDDFLAQKFGQDSYARVDARVAPARKLASVNRFNKKKNKQFVLLLENRACFSTMNFLSLDVIILYNSDWNPENDYRALQKISIVSAIDQIRVFRLYSSCTVEESALVLAKKNLNLDNNLQASSHASSHSLLMWGAACLFSKLDDYLAENASDVNSISRQLLLNEITEEFQSIFSECGEISERVHVISKVKLDVGSYSAEVPMLGEAKIQLKDVEEPHIFWRKLLDRKDPQWKHTMGECPRNRKRVHYLDESLGKSDTEIDDGGKKRRSALTENGHQASAPVELQEHQATQVANSSGGPSRIVASSSFQPSLRVSNASTDSRDDMSGRSTLSPEVDECGAEERNAFSDDQESLYISLQEEMERLCHILKLSEDVTHSLRRFQEYVIVNHPFCRDSLVTMQAFQISMLWAAASISKQEVDKAKSLILAKQFLNYQCTEEQVQLVYSKMLDLKWMYLQCSLTTNLDGDCSLAEENTKNETHNIRGSSSPSSSVKLKNVEMKVDENSTNEEHYEGQIPSQPRQAAKDKCVRNEIDNIVNEIQRKCDKRMMKLIQKQKQEIQEVFQNWEVKKIKLETDHELASALIRCIYSEGSARAVKLKILDGKFAKEMEGNNLLKDRQVKDLEVEQSAARNEERRKVAHWLAKAKACCSSEIGAVSTTAEEVEGNASTGTPSNLASINQPKLAGEIICVNPPAFGERVTDEIRAVEVSSEVPENVPSEIVDNVNPAEMISMSNKEHDKGDTNGLPDALVNQRDRIDDGPPSVLPLARQISETSQQTEASLQRCDLLPLQSPEDQIRRHLSTELTIDQGAQAIEDQNTFQSEVAALEIVGSVSMSQSDSKLPDGDAPTHAVEDHGTMQIKSTSSAQSGAATTPLQIECINSVNASPNENQSTTIEAENQSHDLGKSSSQTTEAAETEMLSHESASHTWESLEVETNHINIGSIDRVSYETTVQLYANSQNSVDASQAVVGADELPNENALQVGIDLDREVTSWDSPYLFAESLQKEWENIYREIEQLEKSHREMVSLLKSNCGKEMQESIAQVVKKYEVKLQDAEAEYISKKNGLGAKHQKVVMNKMLAEAFSLLCVDLQASGVPGTQQDIRSSSMHHLHQLSQQHSVRSHLVAINNIRPAANQDISAPAPHLQAFRPPTPSSFSQHHTKTHATFPNFTVTTIDRLSK